MSLSKRALVPVSQKAIDAVVAVLGDGQPHSKLDIMWGTDYSGQTVYLALTCLMRRGVVERRETHRTIAYDLFRLQAMRCVSFQLVPAHRSVPARPSLPERAGWWLVKRGETEVRRVIDKRSAASAAVMVTGPAGERYTRLCWRNSGYQLSRREGIDPQRVEIDWQDGWYWMRPIQ